jgi:1,4-alpha-glucan branching enzyme
VWNIEFTLTASTAKTVAVAGDFNNWSPTEATMHKKASGEWAVSVRLPAGRYLYKLIVDGKWMPDPDNPTQVPDGYGGTNSVVVVGQ